MAIINKEPFITPEMIAAWNAGGGIFEGMTEIYSKSYTISEILNGTHNTTLHFYRVMQSLTQAVEAAMRNANTLIVQIIFSNAAQANTMYATGLYDNAHNGDRARLMLTAATNCMPYGVIALAHQDDIIYFDVGETFTANVSSGAFTYKIYGK